MMLILAFKIQCKIVQKPVFTMDKDVNTFCTTEYKDNAIMSLRMEMEVVAQKDSHQTMAMISSMQPFFYLPHLKKSLFPKLLSIHMN